MRLAAAKSRVAMAIVRKVLFSINFLPETKV